MARVHKWYFLVNQAGEPIEGAQIWINLAGTGAKSEGTPAWVYFDEFGAAGTREAPQLSTLENGYFEFWIDEDEDFDVCNTAEIDASTATSYGFNQKFRIDWDKQNVHTGFVDYVDVFPANRYFQPADLNKCDSLEMNKVISNEMACRWNYHSLFKVTDPDNPGDITEAHGLDYLLTTEPNNIVNKILSNQMGWEWDVHKAQNVWEHSQSPSGTFWGTQAELDAPHDLWPVNPDNLTDTKYNKVVSNQLIKQILIDLEAIKYGVFTVGQSSGDDAIWAPDDTGDNWEAYIPHNFEVDFPHVTTYAWEVEGVDGYWRVITNHTVEFVDPYTIRVKIFREPGVDPVDLRVRISV